MFGIQQKMAQTAKRAGFLSGGLLLCAVGVGFLTVSVWLGLVPFVGAPLTAAIIAGGYLGVGLILIGVGAGFGHPTNQQSAAEPPKADGPPIVQAFLHGLQAGSNAERARH